MSAPGSAQTIDRWGDFLPRLARLPAASSLVVVDARVEGLHPGLSLALGRLARRQVIRLTAGESVKGFHRLAWVVSAAGGLPRTGTLVAIGGGTIGDLCTVAAHLIKRGVRLIHAPTTLLAAVDSSLGGKGAVNVPAPGAMLKNAAGVFHNAAECWLWPELFSTLSPRQLREGATEAWKMVVTLDAARWRRYRRSGPPPLPRLVRDARALKAAVCAKDPYDLTGARAVLNFGHTFGHVLESLSGFRLGHGDAVGLGMLCALDVGVALRVTPPGLAAQVEAGLKEGAGVLGRSVLARHLKGRRPEQLELLLAGDKKATSRGQVQMVLLERLGSAGTYRVPREVWSSLLEVWRTFSG